MRLTIAIAAMLMASGATAQAKCTPVTATGTHSPNIQGFDDDLGQPCNPYIAQPVANAPTPSRTYTLAEIDRMRKTLMGTAMTEARAQCEAGRQSCLGPNCLVVGCPEPSEMSVELRLQTDILAGISPEALEQQAKDTK